MEKEESTRHVKQALQKNCEELAEQEEAPKRVEETAREETPEMSNEENETNTQKDRCTRSLEGDNLEAISGDIRRLG